MLSRSDDRRLLLFTLGAAGLTVLVMLALLFVPAIDACNGDRSGFIGCLRHVIDQRLDLPVGAPQPAPPQLATGETVPVVAAPPEPGTAPVVEVPGGPEPVATTPGAGDASSPAGPVTDLAEADWPPNMPRPAIDAAAEAAKTDLVEVVALPEEAPEPAAAAAALVVAELPTLGTIPEITRSIGPDPDAGQPALADQPEAGRVVDTPPVIPDSIPPLPLLDAADDARAVSEGAADPLETTAAAVPAAVETLAAPVLPPALAAALDAFDPQLLALPIEATAPPTAAVAVAGPEPAEAPEPVVVAIAVPPPAAATPELVAPPVLPPTIDAVEIDGEANFVAGDGPAGALMRLYVDDVLVGESAVEKGRWLVEGVELFTRPRQLLRVEAVSSETGMVLSSAAISFVIELHEAADEPPAAALPEADPAPEVVSLLAAEPEPPAPPLSAVPAIVASQVAAGEAQPAMPAADPEPPAAADVPAPVDQPTLPPIRPVVPSGETASVTILGTAGEQTAPDLPRRPPAVIAQLAVPQPAVPTLRAVPYGDPAAGRFLSGKAIIRRGDTLWDIAHRYYGRGIRYDTIFRANRDQIARPSRIYPGQVFDLPLVYDD